MRIPSELRRRFAVRFGLALISFWVAASIIFLLTTGTVGDSLTQKLTNLENQGTETRLTEIVGEIEVAANEGAALAGEWLADLAVRHRLVREADAERGAALLVERNPELDFPSAQGRPYAPTGTRLTLHDGISLAELASVHRISAADILEVNPAGSPGNPDGQLDADTILRHGDVIALPLALITSAAIRHRLGLDQSLGEQYGQFLWEVVRFDYRPSLQTQEESLAIVARALPRTVQLNLFALLLALVIALPLGWLARGGIGRRIALPARGVAVLGLAVPSFVLALLLIAAVTPGGLFEDGLWSIPLTSPGAQAITDSPRDFFALYGIPAFCGGLLLAGMLALAFQRGAGSDALLRGLRVWLPVIIGLNLVLELLFDIQGFGLYLLQALNQADLPVVTAICVITALFLVWCLLMIDSARDVLAWQERRT